MRKLLIAMLFVLGGCAGHSSDSSLTQALPPVVAQGKAIHVSGKRGLVIASRMVSGCREGIFVEDCQDVRIENCTVSSCGTLIRLLNCRSVSVSGCNLRNPTGPADPDGQAIQLDKCQDVVIVDNTLDADAGKSLVEDWISIFDSRRVVVKGNRISGGATSVSGTGICVDHTESSDVLIEGNTLIRCGAVGINVAGGSDITIRNNRILDTFIAEPDAGNVGIAVMAAYGTSPSRVTISGNIISVLVPSKGDSPFWDQTGKAVIRGNAVGRDARAMLSP